MGALISLWLGPHALANAGEWKLNVGLGVANTSSSTTGSEESIYTVTAPTVEVGGVLSLTDFWQIGVAANWGPTFGDPHGTTHTLNVNLEGRFILDALTWVPYLAFGVGGWNREIGNSGTREGRLDASVFGGFGIDYRPQRDWSIGFLARGHVLVTDIDATIGPFDAQILGSFYFD